MTIESNDLTDRIIKELEKETSEIDELLARRDGLPDLVSAALTGSMRRWVWVVGFVTLIVTGLFIWAGVNFYQAETLDDRVFWGVWFILGVLAQVTLKQWQWMEMNRSHMMREIKRLELAVVALTRDKFDKPEE